MSPRWFPTSSIGRSGWRKLVARCNGGLHHPDQSSSLPKAPKTSGSVISRSVSQSVSQRGGGRQTEEGGLSRGWFLPLSVAMLAATYLAASSLTDRVEGVH